MMSNMSILPRRETCLWGINKETGHNKTDCGMENYFLLHGNFDRCPFCGQLIVWEKWEKDLYKQQMKLEGIELK